MNFGINSWLFRGQVIEDILPGIAGLGFNGVEISGFPMEFTSQRRFKIRTSLPNYGIKIITVSVGVAFANKSLGLDLCSGNKSVRERTVGYIKDCIDFAADLDAGIVYVCTVTKPDAHIPVKKAWEWIIESLRTCADYAMEKNIRLALEPFPSGIVDTIDVAIEVVNQVNSSNLGILIDTGHLNITGEDLTVSVEKARKFLVHIHINNNDGVHDLHYPPYNGTLKKEAFSSFVNALKQVNYQGYYSFEIITAPDPFDAATKSLQFFKNLTG
ncbi:sugar phosphate isomerase/epimerase [Candidatus Bathyarchaeota archaeon]|nr:sugar phosphate isomerase/epimerase [Candidatus Bathyarchaeota archaeon]